MALDSSSAVSETARTRASDEQKQIARLERRLDRERKARRKAEEIADRGMRDLWLANQELDARVEERTVHLAEALEQLKVASSARDRFLSTLSHEIRTPLNGVLGMLELIESHLDGDQGGQYHAAATESAERLDQLVTRLLDMVELDSGRLATSTTEVVLADFADRVTARWQREALRSGHLLTVSHGGKDSVVADEQRVEQIVNELIHNALTHANPGAVRVELDADDDHLSVTVSDSGPGMSPDRLASVMSDFAMGDDSTARLSQGLGLGLGLCRRIAEAIGGTLTLASDGSTTSGALSVPARGHSQY